MAEVFLVISAYSVASMSTNTDGEIHEWSVLVRSAKKRFVKLYAAHMFMLVAIVGMSVFGPWHLAVFNNSTMYLPLKRLLFGSILLMQPVVLDILPMYIVLAILNPFLLTWFKKYNHFMVLCPSMLLWAVVQFFDVFKHERYNDYAIYPHFLIFAWQFLYVSSIFLFLHKQTFLKYDKVILKISSILCLAFFIFKHWIYSSPLEGHVLSSITDMGILRFLNVMCVVCLCLALNLDLKNNFITRFFSWVGKNALVLFCLHAICFYFHVFFTMNLSANWDLNQQLFLCMFLLILPFVLLTAFKLFWLKWSEH